MSSLPCPPQHWERFSELLDLAMDLPPPTLAIWLDALAGDDAELRPWLARVLGGAPGAGTGSFLDRTRQPNPEGDGPSLVWRRSR